MADYTLAVVGADEQFPPTVVADYQERTGSDPLSNIFHAWHLPIVSRLLLEDDGRARGFLLSRQSHLAADAQQILFYHALTDEDADALLPTALGYLQEKYRAIVSSFAPANPAWLRHFAAFTRSSEQQLTLAMENRPAPASDLIGYSLASLLPRHVGDLTPVFAATIRSTPGYHINHPSPELIRSTLANYAGRSDQWSLLGNRVLLAQGEAVGFSVAEAGDSAEAAHLRHLVVAPAHQPATMMLLAWACQSLASGYHTLTADVATDDPALPTYLASNFRLVGQYDSYYWWHG